MGRDRREPLARNIAPAGPPYGLDTPQPAPQRALQPCKAAKCTPPPRAKSQRKLTPAHTLGALKAQREIHATRRTAAARGHKMHAAPSHLAHRA